MSIFHFQQFSVRQARSAMKVCTDSALFGAMTPLQGGERVLDIGTGTGLLALMAAQLGAVRITGVELCAAACAEAHCNYQHSPWGERLELVHDSIQGFAERSEQRYDLIISNPPFFHNHSKTADPQRNQARHADLLPLPDLLACVAGLLAQQGLCYLLLPCHAVTGCTTLALQQGLHLITRTDFRGYARNQAKVSALTFSRQPGPVSSGLMTIYRDDGSYTEQSSQYLAPFLLRFAQSD